MGYLDYDNELHAESIIQDDSNFKQVENMLAYNKDVEYMKRQFPEPLQAIQIVIDDECDQLEYSGSVMFDEFPDKTHLGMIVDKILLRLTPSENDNEDNGELKSASLDIETTTTRSYCPDDAMLDCEEEMVEATELQASGWGAWGPPPPPKPWGPPPRPCFGPLCPIANRRCGSGRWCPPVPFAHYDNKGNPNWMRHLVENMLFNEMNYRRSRYRNHHF
ncbi:hypothetical protein [[Clostridium] polysaccharolyticum]|jgi:hypothetical protein|uniref:Uncharacterized protein n=1 Tax=[Clostridium] polysaccharolyticum TaxID=29364 RepID=A0A1I0BSP8_9FIRM|nr:hypothetical protein [[Clostridium] polysaccharolyticum]SET09663.1 hypothetical protein SAMN04487772_10865 [[Clostridium] polysaccharolyticum]